MPVPKFEDIDWSYLDFDAIVKDAMAHGYPRREAEIMAEAVCQGLSEDEVWAFSRASINEFLPDDMTDGHDVNGASSLKWVKVRGN